MDAIFRSVSQIISPVYLVGGSVRDILLGREPLDYDFATPLTPDQIELAIRKASKKPYTVGKRFGTIGVKVDNQLVEITTFRSETYTSGNRKPKVSFVNDLHSDLSRRDFTMNAIALDSNGKYSDPFNGRADIKQGVIRAVGNPTQRFREDPLRMLRAARFVAQLDFSLDAATEKSIAQHAQTILEISRERWVMELDKLLLSPRVEKGLEVLARTRLLHFMLPEMGLQVGYDQNTPYHSYTLWEHTKQVVSLAPPQLELRWAALFQDAGKPFVRTDKLHKQQSNYVFHEHVSTHIALRYAAYLHWSKARTDAVINLVRTHMNEDSPLRPFDTAAK